MYAIFNVYVFFNVIEVIFGNFGALCLPPFFRDAEESALNGLVEAKGAPRGAGRLSGGRDFVRSRGGVLLSGPLWSREIKLGLWVTTGNNIIFLIGGCR